jgi:4-hydroxyphenylacetate 3-monooxygenase
MGVRTGDEYLAGLNDNRRIIYNGEIIKDVTKTPGFRHTAMAIAQYYDFQHLPEVRDIMTYETEDGERVGVSFIEPRSKEDLRRRAAAYAAWAEVTCGFMGRAPDYMNCAMMAVGAASHHWGKRDQKWADNARNIYLDSRDRDLCLTHTFAQPHTDRFKPATEQEATLRVVRETEDGPIVRGAKAVGTLAPWCDTNMSIMSPPLKEGDENFAISFNHPVDWPGVYWVCRDVLDPERSLFDAPLSSRGLDEMDCTIIFDDALIPWEWLYLYKDVEIANGQGPGIKFQDSLAHHVLMRGIAKMRFMLGVAHLVAESSQINQFFNVQERLGEMSVWLMNLESLAVAAVEGAEQNPENGLWYCHLNTLRTSLRLLPEYNRMTINHLISMGGSGFVSTPQEATLEKFGELLEPFYRGNSPTAREKIATYRLAWDLAGSGWGSRNELYERFFFGEHQRSIVQTYLQYDKSNSIEQARRMLLGEASREQPFPLPTRFGGPELPPYEGEVGGQPLVGRPMSAANPTRPAPAPAAAPASAPADQAKS